MFKELKPFTRYRKHFTLGPHVEFIVYRRKGNHYDIRYWNGLKSKLPVDCLAALEAVEV